MDSVELASQRERAAWARYIGSGKTFDLQAWRRELRRYHDQMQLQTELLAVATRAFLRGKAVRS